MALFQKLYISDASSLHGTFLNDSSLTPNEPKALEDGDVVRFGIPIDRGRETYNPYAMKVAVRFENPRYRSPRPHYYSSFSDMFDRPVDQPVIFRVPDDTDIDDISGDEDTAVQHSASLLHQHNIRPARSPQHNTTISIDLTGHGESTTWDLEDGQQEPSAHSSLLSNEKPVASVNALHVDLTSQDEDCMSDVDEVFQKDSRNIPDTVLGEADDVFQEDSRNIPDTMIGGIDDEDEQSNGLSDAFDGSQEVDIRLTATSDSEMESVSDFPSSDSDSDMLDEESADEISTALFVPVDELEEPAEFADGECKKSNPFARICSSLGSLILIHSLWYLGMSCSEHDSSHEDEYAADFENPDDKNELDAGAPTLATPESDDHIRTPVPNNEQVSVEQGIQSTVAPEDLWTSPLPPMRPGLSKLPDLSQLSSQTSQESLRLPPIFAAIPRPRQPELGGNVYYRSTGDVMGAKTGKFEYFYAREHNKTATRADSTSQAPDIPVATWMPPLPNSPEIPTNASFGPGTQDTNDSVQCNPSSSCYNERLSTNTAEVPGPWSTSGEKFLKSPLSTQYYPSPAHKPADMALDETSAYQYEESKKAAYANGQVKESFMTINKLVDPPNDIGNESEQRSEQRSLKRKVDDISELTPEERVQDSEPLPSPAREQNQLGVKDATSMITSPLQQGNSTTSEQDVIVLEDDITRPAKRIHRAAEVVCYAAIGAAVAMSALIATAPTF